MSLLFLYGRLQNCCLQCLHVVELLVVAIGGKESVMSAVLNDASLVEHVYLVGMLDGGQAVGNGYGGARLHEFLKRILHKAFRLGVES